VWVPGILSHAEVGYVNNGDVRSESIAELWTVEDLGMIDDRGQNNPIGADKLESLKGAAPVTPEQSFLAEANALLLRSVEQIAKQVQSTMRADDYKVIKQIADHTSLTRNPFEKMDLVRDAAAGFSSKAVEAAGSIYPDFGKALSTHGVSLDPAKVKALFDGELQERAEVAVRKVMVRAYEECKTLCEQREREAQARADQEAARRAELQRLAAEQAREAARLAAEQAREAARLAAEQAREAEARAAREATRFAAQRAEDARLAIERERAAREQARDAREQAKDANANQKTGEQLGAEECRKDLQDILTKGKKLGPQELIHWIKKGLTVAKDQVQLGQKLRDTGLIDFDTKPDGSPDFDTTRIGQTKPSFFRAIRTASLVSWGATVAASALTIGAGVATGGFGLLLGCAASFLVNAGNMGVQSLLKKRFNDRLENTWKELKSELGTVDASRAPALTGAMYLLVDKYSPIILAKGRTKFWLPGKPSSTTAVLDHLKEACLAGLNNLAQNTQGWYKGMDVKEKLNLAEPGLKNLQQRWRWHFKQSDWYSAMLTTGTGLASVSVFCSLAGF
jgi:hypothetical protein